jgi:hypothetical protein
VIKFQLPNFRVRVSEIKKDVTGVDVRSTERDWRYCYAADKEQAIARIKWDRNIYVYEDTIETCNFDQEWQNEIQNILKDISDAIAADQNPDFPGKWGKLKQHLIDMFHGKCGYCEALFATTSFGDVEHYRPKGRVSEDKNHKGYYWLAYNPTNYLPACQLCNEPAKRDHFPIDGIRASSEGDALEAEVPLLLNPYTDCYEEHLEFLPTSYVSPAGEPPKFPGDVIGKTKKGTYTISTMEIYREPIRQARQQEMMAALQGIQIAMINYLVTTRNWDQFIQALQKSLSEDRPFRTAVYYELRDFFMYRKMWDQVKPVFTELGFQTG